MDKSILMIFIDGVGIGEKDAGKNPFFRYKFRFLKNHFGAVPHLGDQYLEKDGKYIFPTDARLGVEGLPQSGTGQTAIFCGINAAQIIGKHHGPYPYSTLIPMIGELNILGHFKRLGKRVRFANAYPKVFFDYLKSGRQRLSVTTLSCRLSGIPLSRGEEVRRGKALTAEITNERWNRKLGYRMPVIKPELAARRLIKIAAENDFTLYEFFLTDHLGHGRIPEEMDTIIDNLDRFLDTVLAGIDKERMTLLICSDHGNFEDLSIKTHTLNPALTIAAGYRAKELGEGINDLTMIKASILKL